MSINYRYNLKYYFVWFILIFTSFEGLGLRTESWGGLGYSGLGWYGCLQLIVLCMSIILPFLINTKFFFDSKCKTGLPAKLTIGLVLVITTQSLFIALFNPDFSIISLFSNLAKFKLVLLYFVFVYLLSRPNGITIALNSTVFCAIISSFIVLYFILSGNESPAIKVLTSSTIGSQFRVLLPTGMLITAGFFLMLINYRFKRRIWHLAGSLFCFVPILLQMHRTVLISLPVVILFAVYKLYGLNFRNLIFILSFSCVIVAGIIFSFHKTGTSQEQLVENILHTRKEVSSISGNFGVRFYLPINSLLYVVENYAILGVGLNWDKIDFEEYLQNKFVAAPSFDSGFNNIIIIYGITGIFIYSLLIYRLFIASNNAINIALRLDYTAIAYFILFMLTYLLLTSTGSDNFLLYNSTYVFTFVIALTYSLERKLNRTLNNDYITA